MAVTNVLGVHDRGLRAVLTLEWNGEPVAIHAEQKPSLVQAGLIYLGSQWESKVPPITWGTPPGTTVLRGFTRDREIHRLYRSFAEEVRLGTFKPGPRS